MSVDHTAANNRNSSPQRAERGLSSLARRLSPSSINRQQQQRASSNGSTNSGKRNSSTNNNNYYNYQEPSSSSLPVSIDALVLVGTLEGPPKGYVAFEHEEEFGICEQVRLRCLREREIYWRCLQQQQQRQQQQQLQEQQQFQSKLEKLDEEKVQELNSTTITNAAYYNNTPTKSSSIPASSSSITIRASGNTQKGYHYNHFQSSSSSSSSSLSLATSLPSSSKLDMSSSRDSKMGLDLSSSSQYYGGNNNNNNSRIAVGGRSPWKAGVGVGGGVLVEEGDGSNNTITPSKDGGGKKKMMTTLFSELSISSSSPPPPHGDGIAATTNNRGINPDGDTVAMQFPSVQYEPDLEPIHIIRTVHPDEHPLQVRDEMIKSLERLRKLTEEQMGLIGQLSKNNAFNSSPGKGGGGGGSSRRQQLQQQPQVSVRWYFQPCSPLGGIDSSASLSPKIQSIPAYIELEGYCTDDDHDGDDDKSGDGRFDDDEYDNMTDEDEDGNQTTSHIDEMMSSTHICRLNKEKLRIAVLRELSDSPFVVSGYLLKQSQKDPNVWRRVYCVLAVDKLWVIGRVRPLSEFPHDKDVDSTANHDVLSSLRVGSHSYINLLRSILIEREEPLNHRLPNTFRIVTSLGKTHSFRAFNSQSSRSWTAALSEKIIQTHTDGMMDLAHVITEEETLARCRRMEDIAVTPFLSSVVTVSTEITPLSMDIVRFGMSVAEYRELCRKVDEAMQLYKNSGGVVNVQTRVGGSPNSKAKRASLSSLSANQRARNEVMVSSVWEDARVVASKSAQLLHEIATSQHSILEAVSEDGDAEEGEEKVQSSVGVDNDSMKDLIEEQKNIQTILSKHWKHQVTPEPEAESDMDHLPPLNLFDDLLKQFHSFSAPTECLMD